mmetsp:Transcript_27230/g.58507  ORF Transcript_27230/g.58507 Transcript_27230/m.58507 type:complete len:713 (+) Transcript_27230:50-2188(+)
MNNECPSSLLPTMGTLSAAIGGFVLGIASAAAVYILLKPPEVSEERKEFERLKTASLSAGGGGGSQSAGLASGEQRNFLCDLVARLWSHLGPAIGDTIKTVVEPMFADLLPGPLKGLHFAKVDFGQVPIVFDNIVVHPLKDGTIQFDMDVVWDGACDIDLKAGALEFGVQNIKFFGRMQFVMNPLSDVLPCIGAIQYTFISPPTIDLDFTGIANVADFAAIAKIIQNVLDDIIASLLVLPNRMTFKMDPACDYRKAFVPPIGIARVTAISGRGFKVEKRHLIKDDVPDVYLKLKLGDKVWQTSMQKNNLTPEWNETADFLLSDNNQVLHVGAWDEDKGMLRSDDDLGKTSMTIAEILLEGKTKEVELLDSENRGTGAFVTLYCDVCRLKSDPKAFDTLPPSNHFGGLLTIIVTKAFNLPLSKEEAESFVKVKYGEKEYLTGVVVDVPDCPGWDCLNPVYDVSFLVPITPEHVKEGLPDVIFELQNGSNKPSTLGSLAVSHKSLLAAPENTIKAIRSIGEGGAKLEFHLSLHGIEAVDAAMGPPSNSLVAAESSMASTQGGMGHSLVAPDETPETQAILQAADELVKKVKKVNVTIIGGKGFKITKKKFGMKDIPDVYCTVKYGSSPKVWRTSTVKNNVSPEWKESEKYILSNENEVISLDAWDANRKGDDTHYGSFRVTVAKVLLSSGKIEMELLKKGANTGCFVTLSCFKE